jgi:hypothetical protein
VPIRPHQVPPHEANNGDHGTSSLQESYTLFGFGVAEDIAEGRVVYRLGEKTYDLIVIKSRAIDMTWDATLDAPEDVVVTRSPELTSDCQAFRGHSAAVLRVDCSGRGR